jgi:hypothetical protein
VKPKDDRFRTERVLRSGIAALLLALLAPAATATAQINEDPACTFVPVPGPFAMVEQWNWDSSTTLPSHVQVMMTPIVASLTDDDGDPVAINVDSIFQDEPLDGLGDGHTCPDGSGVGTDTSSVRAERSGTKKVPGDGRVYHIGFSADDGQGGACAGTLKVCVPHDRCNGDTCVDQGPLFDSTDGGC